MGKAAKKAEKPKSRSKMARQNKKKGKLGNLSKPEKKFHRKVKSNVPLKKNQRIYQKNKNEGKQQRNYADIPIENDDQIEEETVLPLDMLSDDEFPLADVNSDDEDNDEQMESYERVPRTTFSKMKEERALLPIKTDRGQLIPQSMAISKIQSDESDIDEEIEDQQIEEKETVKENSSKPVSIVELVAERQRKLDEAKQNIVHVCDLIMRSPYEEISSLKRLREMLNLGDPLISMSVRKLVMLSLVELFRDIIPGYRIRSLKEQTKEDEQQMKKTKSRKNETLSKDVKIIRNFEQTLLKHYQFFIDFLEQCVKKNLPAHRSNKTEKKLSSSKIHLGRLAVQCLCKLLTNSHHFNFRTNLINIIVQQMGSSDSLVQKQSCFCISSLLREDHSAELSLEIVRFVSKLLKTRSYAVEPSVLDVFLSLNIREISPIEEKKNEKEAKGDFRSRNLSRRDRRLHKEKQELNKVLENKTMAERQTHRLKINRQIIELIFLNYFRLLKRRLNLRLMSSVCEGLAKYSNLINIEYMDDLIGCFYVELTAEQSGLNIRAKFHCLITVFSILNRQQVLIHIDPQRFYALFYSLLLPCPADDDIDLVIKLLQLMLLDRYKQLSKNKLLAFIKRLSTMILNLQSNKSVNAILVMIKALLTISPMVTDQLFDNEFSGSGINYLPELNDPEYCNPQNATLFELVLLKTSSDKIVRQQCEEILNGKFQNDIHVLRASEEKALAHLREKVDEQ